MSSRSSSDSAASNLSTAINRVKGLVLAGGKGTRLRPLTYAMAKQLVPVANKPILHFAMDSMYDGGIRDFGIIISPETGAAIEESLTIWKNGKTGDNIPIQLTFIMQDAPSGLAHAVRIAHDYLQNDSFMMYLGDNLINADMKALIARFLSEPCDAAIMLKPVPNPSSFGVAELNERQEVIRLVEKPKEPKSDLALVGVYLFTHKIFDAISRIQPSWRGELEITDAIQRLIDDNGKVHSSVHQGWWLDTGKKDDLLEANQIVLHDCVTASIQGQVDSKSKLTGKVSVGAGSTLVNCQITGPVAIGANCHLENSTIGPYTSIGDGGRIEESHLEGSVILENCQIINFPGKIEKSLMGKGCKIHRLNPDYACHQFLLADHSEILG